MARLLGGGIVVATAGRDDQFGWNTYVFCLYSNENVGCFAHHANSSAKVTSVLSFSLDHLLPETSLCHKTGGSGKIQSQRKLLYLKKRPEEYS